MVETKGRLRNPLLICGILSSLLWVGTDILAGTLWNGYSFTHQAISELSGIGAPTRPLIIPLGLAYSVLVIAFGFGVWKYSRKRALRIIGGLMVTIGTLGFIGVPLPLQLGVAEATFTNIMHSIIAGFSGFLFLLSMGFGASACGKRFRLYSIGTLLTLILIGAVSVFMSGADITQHGFNEPPQWFGLIERIDIYGSMLWTALLAIVLLRAKKEPRTIDRSTTTSKLRERYSLMNHLI
ncbi:MAG: DUF998 domain-containing protein [Candidatus Bathyarchaeota archaeon]|nr:DUF998 domain-containing protein [Candidatus Bathyarchaeota archaeon]